MAFFLEEPDPRKVAPVPMKKINRRLPRSVSRGTMPLPPARRKRPVDEYVSLRTCVSIVLYQQLSTSCIITASTGFPSLHLRTVATDRYFIRQM
jgi:hypothetical protein